MNDAMHKPSAGIDSMLDTVWKICESLPFNRHLGLEIDYLKPNEAAFSFSMRDELVGNTVKGVLHGGVISAVLDAVGGMTACASAIGRMDGLSPDEVKHRLARMGTIDMRVDYLRPGKGTRFFCAGKVMRTGKKVAVTRMELKNQDDLLIAVGTAAYIVG